MSQLKDATCSQINNNFLIKKKYCLLSREPQKKDDWVTNPREWLTVDRATKHSRGSNLEVRSLDSISYSAAVVSLCFSTWKHENRAISLSFNSESVFLTKWKKKKTQRLFHESLPVGDDRMSFCLAGVSEHVHVCTLGPERVVGTSLLDCRIMQFTKCFISVLICVPSKLPNSSTNSDHLHLTSDASTGRLIGLCKMTELVCIRWQR